MKIGFGYDVHRLVPDRAFILGGVNIPYELGLLGHSDADVLTHALMDSMLGALALGDIGKYFPDTDNKYKDADSIMLLKEVAKIINEKNYVISNADITVALEKPKIAKYIPSMREKISDALGSDVNNISIKATTEEGLGFSGRKEGVKAYSVCLLKEIN